MSSPSPSQSPSQSPSWPNWTDGQPRTVTPISKGAGQFLDASFLSVPQDNYPDLSTQLSSTPTQQLTFNTSGIVGDKTYFNYMTLTPNGSTPSSSDPVLTSNFLDKSTTQGQYLFQGNDASQLQGYHYGPPWFCQNDQNPPEDTCHPAQTPDVFTFSPYHGGQSSSPDGTIRGYRNDSTTGAKTYYMMCTDINGNVYPQCLQSSIAGLQCNPDYWNNPPANCQWQDTSGILNCCINGASNPSAFAPVCGDYTPNTTGTDLCPNFMLNYCTNPNNLLSTCSSDEKYNPACWNQACQQYIGGETLSSDAQYMIQAAIASYINNRSQVCGTNNYTSNSTGVNSTPSCQGVRDDSTDPFFTSYLPQLCSKPGACDQILNQYCAQFTRSDLAKDITLQRICGCHLISANNESPGCQGGSGVLCLNGLNPPQTTDQYYTSDAIGPYNCDPMCFIENTIQNASGQCTSNICILDNVTANFVNSEGNVNINMICPGSSIGTGQCRISNVFVNSVNSNDVINLTQNCGQCFVFDNDNPGSATQYPCGTLPPSGNNPPGPPNPTTSTFWDKVKTWLLKLKNWAMNNKLYASLAVILILAVIVILFLLLIWWIQGK